MPSRAHRRRQAPARFTITNALARMDGASWAALFAITAAWSGRICSIRSSGPRSSNCWKTPRSYSKSWIVGWQQRAHPIRPKARAESAKGISACWQKHRRLLGATKKHSCRSSSCVSVCLGCASANRRFVRSCRQSPTRPMIGLLSAPGRESYRVPCPSAWRADTLSITERQRIVRLVVKDVLIGDDSITIRHSISVPQQSPTQGGNLPPRGLTVELPFM